MQTLVACQWQFSVPSGLSSLPGASPAASSAPKCSEKFLAGRCEQFSHTDFFVGKEKAAEHTAVWSRPLTQNKGKSVSENRQWFVSFLPAGLCELRRNGIHVSDRKYFGFTPIVRAKAYLRGDSSVVSKDLLVLKNYFWNTPEEIGTVEKLLSEICESPVRTEVEKCIADAQEILGILETDMDGNSENIRPYVKFDKELLRIYIFLTNLKTPDMSEADLREIECGAEKLEEISNKADALAQTQHITLAEKKRLNV